MNSDTFVQAYRDTLIRLNSTRANSPDFDEDTDVVWEDALPKDAGSLGPNQRGENGERGAASMSLAEFVLAQGVETPLTADQA